MYDYADADVLRRLVRQMVTSRPLAWLSGRVLHRIDGVVLRASRGRATFSSWMTALPVVVLTTTGARTGQPRATPVLGIPDGDGLVVIAANFGKRQHPAWYHNLRADPHVVVTVANVTREYEAHTLTGDEREQQYAAAVRMNPGWLRYRNWAGARQIPVVRLEPRPGMSSGGR